MRKQIIIAGFLLSSMFAFSQEKVYFPLFELLNVHKNYQYSTSKLFKTYVDNNNKYTIILPDRSDSVKPTESIAETQAKAKNLNTAYYLKGELNALNDIMIVSMSLYRTSDGQKVWSDMMKAHTPDDLDPILVRLAKSLGTNEKAAKNGDIYNVSEYESQELDKVNANSNFGIFVGGLGTTFPNIQNPWSGGFGALYSYDLRNIIMDVNGEVFLGPITFLDFNLSVLYPFSQGRNTPFLGGGLGFGQHIMQVNQDGNNNNQYVTQTTDSEYGLIVFIKGGYIVNRTSKTHLQLGGAFCIPAYKVDNSRPLGFMFNVAFLF